MKNQIQSGIAEAASLIHLGADGALRALSAASGGRYYSPSKDAVVASAPKRRMSAVCMDILSGVYTPRQIVYRAASRRATRFEEQFAYRAARRLATRFQAAVEEACGMAWDSLPTEAACAINPTTGEWERAT